jgi:hypothetical protein
MLVEGGRLSSLEVSANVGPCSRMLYIKNKTTQLLTIKDLHPSTHYLLLGITLVHRGSIVAVLELFALAFFSVASARGQWKSPFPLAVILEPPVKIVFPLVVFLRNRQCWWFY